MAAGRVRGHLSPDIGRSPHIAYVDQRFTTPHPLGQLQKRPFPHAVDQQVCLGIEQDGPPDLILPEIVVGKTAQTGLDAADHHRHVLVGLFQAGGVDDDGAVGAGAVAVTRRVRIVVAQLAGRRVMGHHGIHGPC